MPDNNDNQYSEIMHEILGRMPSWIIRRGILVITVSFLFIMAGCYFIKYPQILSAPIVITTINPPADLISRYDGRIDSLYVKNGEFIHRGSIVALLENSADFDAVCNIEKSLEHSLGDGFNNIVNEIWIGEEHSLGDLQSSFTEFQSIALEYRAYLSIRYIDKKKELLEQQIVKNNEYLSLFIKQKIISDEEIKYARKGFLRDSLLYLNNAISLVDVEKSSLSLLQQKYSSITSEAGIASIEIQIMLNRQQIIELSIQQEKEISEYERVLSRKRQELLAAINKWREQYILESPIDGIMSFISYWSSNQRIKTGDRLASVVPIDSTRIIGRLSIPTSGFGKVKMGQIVNVKLNGYPYMEFGVLKGVIERLSAVPDDNNAYFAEVIFPNGLKSTYKKNLFLIQHMDGIGEIITDDMRLIERFFQPIRALFIK